MIALPINENFFFFFFDWQTGYFYTFLIEYLGFFSGIIYNLVIDL